MNKKQKSNDYFKNCLYIVATAIVISFIYGFLSTNISNDIIEIAGQSFSKTEFYAQLLSFLFIGLILGTIASRFNLKGDN